MNSINRTIVVQRDSRELTVRMIDALATAEAIPAYVDEAKQAAESVQSQAEKLDRTGYMELSAPYAIKPLGWRWPLQAFEGATAEVEKTAAAQSWTQVLDRALKSGERIDISRGFWPVREKLNAMTGFTIADDTPVDVQAAQGAVISLGAELGAFTGGFIDVRASAAPSPTRRIPFRWSGGAFDASALNAAAEYGITIFDLFWRTGYKIEDVDFFAGQNVNGLPWGAVDTAITTHNCYGGVISNCNFTGFYDAGVYLSGNNIPATWDMIGEAETVTDCRFYRCNNGVVSKRDHMGAVIRNAHMVECGSGVLASPADTTPRNQGESMQVTGSRFLRMQGRPIFISSGFGGIVSGNTVQDFGCQILSPTTLTPVTAGNGIAGIDIRGAEGVIVHDNTVRMADWRGRIQNEANKELIGIRTGADTGAVFSSDCSIHDNRIISVMRPVLDDSGCARNAYRDNIIVAASNGTSVAAAVQGAGSVLVSPVMEFTVSVDIPSIAAGARHNLTVPAPGVSVGDWVESWRTQNRDHTVMGGLSVEPYCTSDAITIVLTNVSGAAIDLPNTIYTVRVRKA